MTYKVKYQITQTEKVNRTKLAKFIDWFKRKPKAADVSPVALLSWTPIDDTQTPKFMDSTDDVPDDQQTPMTNDADESNQVAGGEGGQEASPDAVEQVIDPQQPVEPTLEPTVEPTVELTTAEAVPTAEKKRTVWQKIRQFCCCCCSQTDEPESPSPAPVDPTVNPITPVTESSPLPGPFPEPLPPPMYPPPVQPTIIYERRETPPSSPRRPRRRERTPSPSRNRSPESKRRRSPSRRNKGKKRKRKEEVDKSVEKREKQVAVCEFATDYLYIGDEKKKSSRIPPALLLSPDRADMDCGIDRLYKEGVSLGCTVYTVHPLYTRVG